MYVHEMETNNNKTPKKGLTNQDRDAILRQYIEKCDQL